MEGRALPRSSFAGATAWAGLAASLVLLGACASDEGPDGTTRLADVAATPGPIASCPLVPAPSASPPATSAPPPPMTTATRPLPPLDRRAPAHLETATFSLG